MSEHNEIIIVKRRHGGDHDGHHGGAWKIAFADFMTAMMAFFLVLWIVNSTSKETRSSIARYFNPIKISDTTPARKGLQNPKEEDFEASSEDASQKPKPDGKQEKASGSAPMIGVPNKGKYPTPPPSGLVGEHRQEPGAEQNDALRPPNERAAPIEKIESVEDPFKLLRPKITRQSYSEKRTEDGVSQLKQAINPSTQGPSANVTANAPSSRENPSNQTPKASRDDPQLRKAVESLARQEKSIPGGSSISVTEVPEGTLISLLDSSDQEMFLNGSFNLSKSATAALARIGKAIGNLSNPVIVAGYTDARAYRKGKGDNFKLSVLRAEAAMSVLIRSGLIEQRVERIEGHADRQPIVPNDKFNAKNRRIDILLRRNNG